MQALRSGLNNYIRRHFNMFTIEWLKAAGIRALKTVAQTAIAMIPAAVMITEVDWVAVLGTAALAGVVSILTSIAGLPEVEKKD